jgi:serine/threonine-protein kinase
MTRTIAHYNLLEKIGTGGMGDVYRARDTIAGRTVALKLPGGDVLDGAARDRFMSDARLAATLSHPNIATLWDVGEDGGQIYLAYEFIAGSPLRAQMAGRSMNVRHALELGAQIADALSEGHSRGVIHGDLRPETIAVSAKGSAKILDFGMARWTRGGVVRARAAIDPGSLAADAAPIVRYMSPEQVLGVEADARSDVFTLSVILYEMVTGRHPFAGGTPSAILIQISTATPPMARVTNSELPKEIEATLSRGLGKELARRQQSAAIYAAELRRGLAVLDARAGEATAAELPALEEERRSRAWIGYALLAAAAGLAWWLFR